jgi:hypothetical protein
LPHARESGKADFPETLIGVIPLRQMDLKVNLGEQKLEGAHGDERIAMRGKERRMDARQL